MPSPTFVAGATTLTFTNAPQRPRRSLELLQAEVASAGGSRFGFNALDVEKLIVLHWPGMSSADLAALELFLVNTVKGMATAFTYTDVAAAAKTVRFAVPEILSTERAAGRHDVTVILLEA